MPDPLAFSPDSCTSERGDERPQNVAEWEVIYAIVRRMNARSSPPQIVDMLFEQLSPFIRFDSVWVSFVRGDALESITQNGDDVPCLSISRAEHADHRLWGVIESGELQSRETTELQHIRAFINVPLRVGERTVGILHLDARSPRAWTGAELRLARLVGELIGGAVESAELLRERDERAREHAENLAILRAVQEASSEGICLVSGAGELLSYNRRFAQIWHLDEQTEALHVQAGTVMSWVLDQLADPDEFLLRISALFDQPDAHAQDEIALRDGRTFERFSAPALAPSPDASGAARPIGRVWTFADISSRKETERQLKHQAFYDAVTGLPNRVLFNERLSRALKTLARSWRRLAVLFLDLDRFKVVNDSLGHDTGDRLLVEVAVRLRAALRPGDLAARFGGDEFVVLLEDVTCAEDATVVAQRIADTLSAPFHLAGRSVSVTASVGIVVGSDPSESPDDILRKADVAMYRAKNSGKARYQLFSESLSHAAMDELQLELDLSAAIKKGELQLFYQPIIHLATGTVGAFEALLRWHHPTRGWVSPLDFIRVAEDAGLIVPIGEWVLRMACSQARGWSDEFGQPIVMHVNISARQLELVDMVAQIARVLRETGLPATQLMIEITESALMSDAQGAARQLETIKSTGAGVSIDDFGTGYSSLAYLELFPLDALKIDRSFVARMDKNQTLVRAITSLGGALDLQIVAEGVETRAQLEAVRALGVQWAQGYLFSQPVPADQVGALLRDGIGENGALTPALG